MSKEKLNAFPPLNDRQESDAGQGGANRYLRALDVKFRGKVQIDAEAWTWTPALSRMP